MDKNLKSMKEKFKEKLKEKLKEKHKILKETHALLKSAQDSKADYALALIYLEKAHVLSQFYAWTHLVVHWEMFKLAWLYRDKKEILGQVPRLLLAIPGSWTGKAPRGNVGSTKMGIFQEASESELI